MSKSQLFLSFIRVALKDRKNLLKNLYNYTTEAEKRLEYKSKYGDPLPFVNILDFLQSEEINNYTFLDGASGISDIALLCALAGRKPDTKFLEIGSWRGESLVNVANKGAKCTSISLPPEELAAIGYPKAAKFQGLFSNGHPNVKHIFHNSLTYDFSQLDEKFDLIFVDGDHTYNGVKKDTENVFKLLKDNESIIVWHDAGVSHEEPRYEVMAAIMDGSPSEARKDICRVTNSLCAIYMKGLGAKSFIPSSPHNPDKIFKINVSGDKYSYNR